MSVMYKNFDPDKGDADVGAGAGRARGPDDAPSPSGKSPRIPRAGQLAIAAVLVAGVTFAGLKGFGGEAQADAPAPPTVTVSTPIERAVTEWDDYTGRFDASQAVEIRPRVSGQLVAIHFKDGDIVRKGQLLFTVDPRPFQAGLAEANARAATARTQLALARSEYARAERLISDEAVSREEVDSLRAAMKSGEAGVAAAEAMVRQRALDLEFAQIRAPVTGRISDRRVDVGNIVSANQSMLTTVLALDPIYFSFDGSEALYLKALRARQKAGGTDQQVEIKLQDEADYSWKGKVDFTDNAIDPRSGTMRGRATIANPDYFLAPGMFGNMRLTGGGTVKALLVPDAAVRTEQARKQLLVVAKDGTVAARPVETGPLVGGLRVIRSGLGPTDRVVIQGVQYAKPGSKVTARQGRIDPPSAIQGTSNPVRAPAASQATLAAR